jgi:hypothetical protein
MHLFTFSFPLAVTENELRALLKQYTVYDKSKGRDGIPIDKFLNIPDFTGHPFIARISELYKTDPRDVIMPEQFLDICSILSSKQDIEKKRRCKYCRILKRVGVISSKHSEPVFRSLLLLILHIPNWANMCLLPAVVADTSQTSLPGAFFLSCLSRTSNFILKLVQNFHSIQCNNYAEDTPQYSGRYRGCSK